MERIQQFKVPTLERGFIISLVLFHLWRAQTHESLLEMHDEPRLDGRESFPNTGCQGNQMAVAGNIQTHEFLSSLKKFWVYLRTVHQDCGSAFSWQKKCWDFPTCTAKSCRYWKPWLWILCSHPPYSVYRQLLFGHFYIRDAVWEALQPAPFSLWECGAPVLQMGRLKTK